MIPAGRGRQPVRLIPVMGGLFLKVGREGEAGGGGQLDLICKYFQDIIKKISLLLLIRVTGQYLAGGMIQQLQTDV